MRSSHWLAAVVVLIVIAGCSGRAPRASPPSTVAAATDAAATASTRPLEIAVAEFYGAMPTTTNVVPVRADGCRDQPMNGPIVDERAADVDGDGRADSVRIVAERPPLEVAPLVLQIQFADGRFSGPLEVRATTVLGAADLDGDRKSEVLVAEGGSTARLGAIVQVAGCAVRRVRAQTGEPFEYTYSAGGSSCVPACYVTVECQRLSAAIDLVLSWGARVSVPGAQIPPPLSDDLVYHWQIERRQLHDGFMVRVSFEEGSARHVDLLVPKQQGFRCV